jgi:hypothetical protein
MIAFSLTELEYIMKYLIPLFLIVSFYQPLHAYSYIDSLDIVIDQKAADLTQSFYKVDKIVQTIRKNIKAQVSLQEIEDFLDGKDSAAFFSSHELQLKTNEQISNEAGRVQKDFKDLQFALHAKLYVYYLEYTKEKMLYKAVENYNTLNYWQNEKFYEAQPFFKKNILRSLSGLQYKENIDNNITQLEQITKQTDAFLGLIVHNQRLLQQAITQQEFEQSLMEAIRLQDDYWHAPVKTYDDYDMSIMIKKSIDQVRRFNVHLLEQYAQCKLPSHIRRNWKGYTFTAAGMSLGAFIAITYGNDISQGLQYFWNESVYGAFERNRKTLSGVIEGPQFDVRDNVNNAEAIMDKMLEQREPQTKLNFVKIFGKAASATKDKNSKLSFEEKKQLVLPMICTIKKHHFLNLSSWTSALELELELKAIEAQEIMNASLKDVHTALGITALIPVVTLFLGSMFASRSLYNSVAYQSIRTLVRRLEVFLNEIFYEAVTFDKEGHLFFLTEQLKLHVNVLTIPEQKLIAADIAALQVPSLDYVQKTNVVQRMYRTYPCLIPARV